MDEPTSPEPRQEPAEDFDTTRFIVMIVVVVCVTTGVLVVMYRGFTATVSAKFEQASMSVQMEQTFE